MKLQAGSALPAMKLARAGGGEIMLGGEGRWQIVVVYRGKHCPLCRKYLKELNGALDEFGLLQTDVVAVSSDPIAKAESQVSEEGWKFPVAYGLTVEQMRTLGLYISAPRSDQETDRPFSEPGLFVTNPQGSLQIIDISNAPFARPDISNIISGLKIIQEKNYPIRGTMA